MPYGTTVDPNFYQEKAANAGRLIQSLLAQQEARKERRDRAEQEQLKFFFQTAEKDPSLANSMGPQLVERYGKKYPVLQALVEGLQDRQKIIGNMDTAAKAYTDKLTGLQNNYGEMQQKAESLPDSLPYHVQVPTLHGMPTSIGPGQQYSPDLTLQMPNPEKAKVQATLSQMNPMMFPVSAMYALPADQQALVHMNPSIKHILPAQMPSLQDVPEEQRPLVMGQMGIVSPEVVDATKMRLGMISKPAEIQKQQAEADLQDTKAADQYDLQTDKQAAAERQRQRSFENQQTLENLRDTHSKQRIAQTLGGQSSLEDKKIAGQIKVLGVRHGYDQKDDGTIPWKSVATSSSQQLKDWRAERSAFLSEQGKLKTSPEEFAAADAKWQAANPRPVRVTDVASRYITNKVNQAVKEDPSRADKALVVTQGQVQRYQSLMRQPGMTEDKALELLFKPAPKRGDRNMSQLGANLSLAGAPSGIDEPEAVDNPTEEQEE